MTNQSDMAQQIRDRRKRDEEEADRLTQQDLAEYLISGKQPVGWYPALSDQDMDRLREWSKDQGDD